MSSDLEHLLQRTGRIRDLARALVRDAATADDVVQDALVAALGREGGPPRESSWLHRAVRSLAADRARGETGRRRREEAAARDERLGDAAESVARVELSRDVAEAVVSLYEPYRSAVTLRYIDGLPPREIARRTGAPVPTVKKRIERGLAALRLSLEEHRGPGGTWAVALLPLTGPDVLSGAEAAGVAAGGGGAALGSWFAVIALAGAVGGGVWFLTADPAGGDPASGGPVLAGSSAGHPASTRRAGDAADQGMRVAPRGSDDGPARLRQLASDDAGAEARPGALSSVQFVDLRGLPVAGLAITLSGVGGDSVVVNTDARGRAAVPVDAVDSFEIVDSSLVGIDLGTGAEGAAPVTVVAPAVDIAGVCVEPGGRPVVGASIRVLGQLSTIRGFPDALARRSSYIQREVETNARGEFALDRVPVHASFALFAGRGVQNTSREFVLPQRDDRAMRLELEPSLETEVPWLVTGHVVGEDGEPRAEVTVSLDDEETATDERGGFELRVQRLEWREGRPLVARGDGGVFAVGPVPDPASAVTDQGAGPYEIVLPDAMLTIEGTVVDRDGVAVAGLQVSLVDATRDGSSSGHLEVARSARAGATWARTDDAGAFAFERVVARPYTVCIANPDTMVAQVTELDPRRGPHRIVFLDDAAPVRGRVVDAFGRGAAGIVVSVGVRTVAYDGGTLTIDRLGPSVVTNDEGWFEHPRVGREANVLRLHQREVPGSGALLTVADPFAAEELEVTVTLVCEVDVTIAAERPGDRISFVDEIGRRLGVTQAYGSGTTESIWARRRPGGTFGRLFVTQTATQVTVRGGGAERTVEITLDPDRVNRLHL